MDERETKLRDAIAQCFKAHEPVSIANVRAKVPEDFFMDFDSGKPLSDAEVFSEIQATYKPTPASPPLTGMVSPPDDEELLGDEPTDDPVVGEQHLRDVWPPETVAVPVEAAPVTKETPQAMALAVPGLSNQVRLNDLRKREQELVGNTGPLQRAHRNAMDALAAAKQDYQRHDPHRQTPSDVAREFREQSQRDRAARKGAYRLTPVAPEPRGEIAFVDAERKFSQGGDGNTFVRRMNQTGNRRGAYGKQSLGGINRDPSRGPVPAPVVVAKPTIPALGK